MTMLAVLCSTWVGINVGTSKRTWVNPEGATNQPENRRANKMAARTFHLKRCVLKTSMGSLPGLLYGQNMGTLKDSTSLPSCGLHGLGVSG